MRTIRKITTAYIVMLCLFTCAIISVYSIPQSAIEKNVERSVAVWEEEGLYKKLLGFKLFQLDNYTDCLMVNLAATADENNAVEAAMMNYYYDGEESYVSLPKYTLQALNGETDGIVRKSYGRYWQGHLVLVRPLLTIMDYRAIRVLNFILLTALCVACMVLMWKCVGRASVFAFGASLLMINCFIIPMSMQFSNCFYISFISQILLLTLPKLTGDNSSRMCFFFCIGAATAFFDFLTTPQLTLGLPMVAMLMRDDSHNSKCKAVVMLSVAWGVGYGLMWASKWGIAYILTGNNILDDAMRSVELRTGNSYKGMDMTIPNILNFIMTHLRARGLTWMLYTAIAIVVACIFLYLKMLKSKEVFMRYAWLLLVAAIVPVWFLLLRNHSIQHGWFTWRACLLTLYSLILFIYYTVDIKKLSFRCTWTR